MEDQFIRAAIRGDLPTVRRILQQPGGLDVNAGDEESWTALHYAVFRSDLAIVQAILQEDGVNVNARTVTGCTPLRNSHLGDHRLPILQALLEAGADPNVADHDGETPLLLYVAFASPISTLEALLDGGANPAARNNNLDTPLHIACFCKNLDAAQLLIRRQGPECLTWKNIAEETPFDQIDQNIAEETPDQIGHSRHGRVTISIRQQILQAYAGMIAQRDGLLCLHSVLRNAVFTDGDNEEFQLPVGKLNTEYLQSLLEYIIALQPGSVRAMDHDGLFPLQVAWQMDFPDLVLNVLLRPYPGALLLLV